MDIRMAFYPVSTSFLRSLLFSYTLQNKVLIYSKLFPTLKNKYFFSRNSLYLDWNMDWYTSEICLCFCFLILFFWDKNQFGPELIAILLPHPSKHWSYKHDAMPSSQIHLCINTILHIIKSFLKTVFLSASILKQPCSMPAAAGDTEVINII